MLTEDDIRSGDIGVVRRYIEVDGGNVNGPIRDSFRTNLETAVYNGQWATASYLIERGADVNQPEINSISILMSALSKCAPISFIELLIARRANLDALDWQSSSIMFYLAMETESDTVDDIIAKIKLLMTHGVNPHGTNSSDNTPIGRCIWNDKVVNLSAFLSVLKDSVSVSRLLDMAYICASPNCLQFMIYNELTGSATTVMLKSARCAPQDTWNRVKEPVAEECRQIIDKELARRAEQKLAFVIGTRLARGETASRLNQNAIQSMRLPGELVCMILDMMDTSSVPTPMF